MIMALYNLSEFIKLIKTDIGIKDIPLPVSDKDILDRFDKSALTEFSLRAPRVETFMVNENEVVKRTTENALPYTEYKIPPWVYTDTTVLAVARFDVARPNGYADFYTPNANWSTPDAIIAASADLRMAAGVASSMAKAPTHIFAAPDRIKVYNGWYGGAYEVEVLLKHDLNLATIQPGTFSALRRLTKLDMKAYLYSELKRKDTLDVGVGTIQLKIDEWSNAEADMQALLDSWDEEGSLDVDHIKYF
jgi:hypothetical protein